MKRLYWESIREHGGKYTVEFVDYYKSGTLCHFWFNAVDGNIGQGDAQTVKPPNYDGAVTYGVTRGQREVSFDGTVVVKSDDRQNRAERMREARELLSQCFDPKYFGTLYYHAFEGDTGAKIYARPTALPVFDEDKGSSVRFKVGFISDDSHWVRVKPVTAAMGVDVKYFRFPAYFFPSATGFIFSKATLVNPTLYDIKPHITLYASETVIDIRNHTTGAFLRFRQPVQEGERIIIDTKRAKAYLEVQDSGSGEWAFRENILHRLTLDSDITRFLIMPGRNEIELMKQIPDSTPRMFIWADIPVMGV